MLDRIHNRLISLRRASFECFGLARYSRPARDGLDVKLAAYLPDRPGVFVEAGAHDGFSDSNTYYLEKIKGWRGVLVEPIPGNSQSCRKIRARSQVYQCALVAPDCPDSTVRMTWGDRMSWVEGAYEPEAAGKRRQAVGRYVTPEIIEVPARTLTSVLDEAGHGAIDFLSLDVEGFELQALRGLDFSRHRPSWMLIECQTDKARQNVEEYLAPRYTSVARLSHHDYLFRCKVVSSS